jgi:SAM-dependent methyltransferase
VNEDPADPLASADADTQRFAADALARGTPTAWFERLYAAAADGTSGVPWDRADPNPPLVDWLAARNLPRGRAIVVGCGYGRDAEYLASLGFDTTAFDISPSAIAGARARNPSSIVRYAAADLLDLPAEWQAAFDVVIEIRNVQALPPPLHASAAAAVASLLAPGGSLFVAAAADDGAADGPPWPLTRADLDGFAVDDIASVSIEFVQEPGEAPRWRAEFHRPAARSGPADGGL